MITSEKPIMPKPEPKPTPDLSVLIGPTAQALVSQQEVSRGFPEAYYRSTGTKEIKGFQDNGRYKYVTSYKTSINYKALVVDFLIWTSASFLVLFLVSQVRRRHV